jgi:hypothetical protein
MAASRLVPYEHVLDPRIHEGVIRRKVRAARISEDDIDTLGLQAFHDRIDRSHHAPESNGGLRLVSALAGVGRRHVHPEQRSQARALALREDTPRPPIDASHGFGHTL